MTIKRLKITNFRNFNYIDIAPHSTMNLIYGVNGSGKSSLLEAIYFLSFGRSFRTHLASRVIRQDQDTFIIYSEIEQQENTTLSIGIEKNLQGKVKIKAGQDMLASISQVAKLIPAQIINPDTFELLNSGPQFRREFLDWGLFHVEQSFYDLWARNQRVLKQRNSAIQQQQSINEIKSWDTELAKTATELSLLRRSYLNQLLPIVEEVLSQLVYLPALTMSFYQGWDEQAPLTDILNKNINRDIALGYTQAGSHRADLVIKIKGVPAHDVLSRGEQKLLICALRLAQGICLQRLTSKKCIYLLDDVAAELDSEHRKQIVTLLASLKSQVFVTAVEKSALDDFKMYSEKVFHVEHGIIK